MIWLNGLLHFRHLEPHPAQILSKVWIRYYSISHRQWKFWRSETRGQLLQRWLVTHDLKYHWYRNICSKGAFSPPYRKVYSRSRPTTGTWYILFYWTGENQKVLYKEDKIWVGWLWLNDRNKTGDDERRHGDFKCAEFERY